MLGTTLVCEKGRGGYVFGVSLFFLFLVTSGRSVYDAGDFGNHELRAGS